jgi:DNA-binding NarL/FixJ family response regulator
MTRSRILLADDHDLFREGLARLINAQPDLEVVGQARDGLEALTAARDLQPDLIIMDIKMPMCDGLEATRLIRAEFAKPRILILTVHNEDEKLSEAIKAGANSYVLKDTNSSEFLRGVRGTLSGEAAIPPKLAAHLLEEYARIAKLATSDVLAPEASDLTPREREVLELIAADATDKEIAGQLSISLHTVKSHVCNILDKLHAGNRREAVRLAARRGLTREHGPKPPVET